MTNSTDNSVLKKLKDIVKFKESQNRFKLTDIELPYPLCIVEDRYGGAYSGANFLAFNKTLYFVQKLPIDAGDIDCENFWNGKDEDYDVNDYTIGKGATPDEALWDLIQLLQNKK